MIGIDLDYYIQETDALVEQIEDDIIDYFENNNITEIQVNHFTLCGEHIEKLIFDKEAYRIFYEMGGVKHRLDTLSISQIITLILSI